MTYDTNNIFAKIIRGEIKADKVYEDDAILAFNDISKSAPVHVLVVPKGEYINFADFVSKANPEMVAYFFSKVALLAEELTKNSGYRLIANTGSNAHQTVGHFHMHILAGKKLGPLLSSDGLLR